MFALQQRSQVEGVVHHKNTPVRVYENDCFQAERIFKSRALLDRFKGKVIVELGCGTADISGPFASQTIVVGIDVNQASLDKAKERFPKIIPLFHEIDDKPTLTGDTLILCEVLEHLESPELICKNWLPRFKNVIISHPLNEPMGCGLSAGEHQWSFTEKDFDNWFKVGGHKLKEREIFQMGEYTNILGVGQRV